MWTAATYTSKFHRLWKCNCRSSAGSCVAVTDVTETHRPNAELNELTIAFHRNSERANTLNQAILIYVKCWPNHEEVQKDIKYIPIALPLFPPTSSYNVNDQWLTEVLIMHSLETQKSIKISGDKDFSPLSFLLHPTFFSAML